MSSGKRGSGYHNSLLGSNDNKDDDTPKSSSKSQQLPFTSRRSPVLCRNGCVASSQPLASSIGLEILRSHNGNAADAAVAMAAVLAVVEPCSTGVGGDMFSLIYRAKDKTVHAVNGSGRCPSGLTLERVKKDCGGGEGGEEDEEAMLEKFQYSVHAVTVPGAVKGWEDMIEKHGSGNLTLANLLAPAIQLATDGFPVSPITSYAWSKNMFQIENHLSHPTPQSNPLALPDGSPPPPGHIFKNPHMAQVLQSIATHGARDGFYNGFPGRAIVDRMRELGGCLSIDDLIRHESTFPKPISVCYRGCRLWQVPPNGQGIAGLIALKGLSALEAQEEKDEAEIITPIDETSCGTWRALHPMMEMMRLGFMDARAHVTEEELMTGSGGGDEGLMSVEELMDEERIKERARRVFDPKKATVEGMPEKSSCTVSFQVVDKEGNAVSFVNSNFFGFGTGIIPSDCGFTLQNRGAGFSLDPSHPNVLSPNKRPYHTIIPGMLTHEGSNDLYATLSNMGGYMQPQGHFQLVVNMLAGGCDPQEAIDRPRFCIADGTHNGTIYLEDGFSDEDVEKLKKLGHTVIPHVSGYERMVFGRAQIIKKDELNGVLWAGSDGRADGCAMGY